MIKELKIIYNKLLPFGKHNGSMAMFPYVFTKRPKGYLEWSVLNHERIHLRQQIEMLLIFFYLWYAIEFIIKYIITRNYSLVMHKISFEQEAYKNEGNGNYLREGHHFAWLKYVFSIED